ncbi:MAG: DnaJ domain-containing protein [Oscillospiraceae bacterium]|nr:DnaJ domain-containing protein [Oscillospiraceae bacterium]
MNDPYQILNIPPTATDEEVKRAYRDLARKYHPDNYHDNPLADLAQEKMKEINEAYDQIQKQRKASSAAAQGYGGASYGGYSGSAYSGGLQQVRLAIRRGDISLAERLLVAVGNHDAEWNFLMGVVCSRRGWMDEAKRYLETAVQMEPNNMEYSNALSALTGNGYRPEGFRTFRTGSFDDNTCLRCCAAWSCCTLFSGGGCYFLPCIY